MIIITAATPWEAQPLARTWGLRDQGNKAYRGRAGASDLLLVQTGIGPEKTGIALKGLDAHAELVISSGFAGALQEKVRSGDLVADPHGAPLTLLEAAQRAARSTETVLHLGRMISVNQVLDCVQKRALGESRRALAADMESAAARQWAQERGADFIVLRVVLDEVNQRLPQGLPESGKAADLARYALARRRDLPLLLQLALLQRRGIGRLSRFLDRFLTELSKEGNEKVS